MIVCYSLDMTKTSASTTPKTRTFSAGAVRDALWIAGFEVGSEWHTGAFTPARERELIAMGALIPTDVAGVFRTAVVRTKTQSAGNPRG